MLCALLCLLLAVARCDGSSTCEDLGFTGHNLCSDCKQLSEMVKDQGMTRHHVVSCKGVPGDQTSCMSTATELTDDCLRCCTEQATSDQKYTKAVLEVCSQRKCDAWTPILTRCVHTIPHFTQKPHIAPTIHTGMSLSAIFHPARGRVCQEKSCVNQGSARCRPLGCPPPHRIVQGQSTGVGAHRQLENRANHRVFEGQIGSSGARVIMKGWPCDLRKKRDLCLEQTHVLLTLLDCNTTIQQKMALLQELNTAELVY